MSEKIYFEDKNLEAGLKRTLGKEEITTEELSKIEAIMIRCPECGIGTETLLPSRLDVITDVPPTSLAGLEHCGKLYEIRAVIGENADLSAFDQLTGLRRISLEAPEKRELSGGELEAVSHTRYLRLTNFSLVNSVFPEMAADSLYLVSCDIDDLSFIERFPRLYKLDICDLREKGKRIAELAALRKAEK